jgi:hypothetical protein
MMRFSLFHPLPDDLYHYLISEEETGEERADIA